MAVTWANSDHAFASSDITLNEPAGAAVDDLLVAFVSSGDSAADGNIAGQTGWTDLGYVTLGGAQVEGFAIKRGASAPDFTWTRSKDLYVKSAVALIPAAEWTGNLADVEVGTATSGGTSTTIDLPATSAALINGDGYGLIMAANASGAGTASITAMPDEIYDEIPDGGFLSVWVGEEHNLPDQAYNPATLTFTTSANLCAMVVGVSGATINTTVTVHKTTGDYSTVQSALDDCSVLIADGYYKVEIQDNAEYTENVVFNAAEIATPTVSHYIWLTCDSAVKHDGTPDSGATVKATSGFAIQMKLDWSRVSDLEVQLASNTGSDECIRLDAGVDNVLISRCIIWSDLTATADDQNGVHMTDHSSTNSISIDNCYFFGFQRAAVHVQQFGAQTAVTYDVNLDHCSFMSNKDTEDDEEEAGAVYLRADDADCTIVANMYNCAAGDSHSGSPGAQTRDYGDGTAARGAPTGSVTWNGSHNLTAYEAALPLDDIDGTDLTTDWQEANDGVSGSTQTTGSYWVVKVFDETAPINTMDLSPLNATDGGNLALANGLGLGVSGYTEPDARQDFSTDIIGNTRPTTNVDIGAFQISAAAAGGSAPALPVGIRTIRSLAIR